MLIAIGAAKENEADIFEIVTLIINLLLKLDFLDCISCVMTASDSIYTSLLSLVPLQMVCCVLPALLQSLLLFGLTFLFDPVCLILGPRIA